MIWEVLAGDLFDENDPIQHTEKLLMLVGKDFAFRGNDEYAKFMKKHIVVLVKFFYLFYFLL